MLYKLVSLAHSIDQPDRPVGHAISCKIFFPATGIGCNLAARRNLLGGHIIQTVHEVHISTIVKEQWFVVTSANTCGTKVETARCYHLISSDIKESNALLAYDQQPFAIVQGLKAKGLADCFQIDDTRLSTVGNHPPGDQYN